MITTKNDILNSIDQSIERVGNGIAYDAFVNFVVQASQTLPHKGQQEVKNRTFLQCFERGKLYPAYGLLQYLEKIDVPAEIFQKGLEEMMPRVGNGIAYGDFVEFMYILVRKNEDATDKLRYVTEKVLKANKVNVCQRLSNLTDYEITRREYVRGKNDISAEFARLLQLDLQQCIPEIKRLYAQTKEISGLNENLESMLKTDLKLAKEFPGPYALLIKIVNSIFDEKFGTGVNSALESYFLFNDVCELNRDKTKLQNQMEQLLLMEQYPKTYRENFELSQLNRQLSSAITKQEYEEAAKLRDRIRDLNNQIRNRLIQ